MREEAALAVTAQRTACSVWQKKVHQTLRVNLGALNIHGYRGRSRGKITNRINSNMVRPRLSLEVQTLVLQKLAEQIVTFREVEESVAELVSNPRQLYKYVLETSVNWYKIAAELGEDRTRIYHWYRETHSRHALNIKMTNEDRSIIRGIIVQGIHDRSIRRPDFYQRIHARFGKKYPRPELRMTYNNTLRTQGIRSLLDEYAIRWPPQRRNPKNDYRNWVNSSDDEQSKSLDESSEQQPPQAPMPAAEKHAVAMVQGLPCTFNFPPSQLGLITPQSVQPGNQLNRQLVGPLLPLSLEQSRSIVPVMRPSVGLMWRPTFQRPIDPNAPQTVYSSGHPVAYLPLTISTTDAKGPTTSTANDTLYQWRE